MNLACLPIRLILKRPMLFRPFHIPSGGKSVYSYFSLRIKRPSIISVHNKTGIYKLCNELMYMNIFVKNNSILVLWIKYSIKYQYLKSTVLGNINKI